MEGALLAGEVSPEEGSGLWVQGGLCQWHVCCLRAGALPPGLEARGQVVTLVPFSDTLSTYLLRSLCEQKFHDGKDFLWFFYVPNT